MGVERFTPTPTTEELADFLQGLAPGAHVAVDLAGLDIATAMRVSRTAAHERGQRFQVVGHRSRAEEKAALADCLVRALPLDVVEDGRRAMVFVDAEASVQAAGAASHAIGEHALGLRLDSRLTVVCLYTEEAMKEVTTNKVYDLHTLVAAPGQA